MSIVVGTSDADDLVGTSGPDEIYGLEGNDYLKGGLGNDTLFGGAGDDLLTGESGDDLMIGGVGNDRYFVASPGDIVQESENEGIDLVEARISYTLPANVEQAFYSGSDRGVLVGNHLDNMLHGNVGNDNLFGLDGNDVLVASGGVNILDGGAGIDSASYFVPRSDYEILRTGRNAYAVTVLSTGLTDSLYDMEFLEFHRFGIETPEYMIALTTGDVTLTDDTPTQGQVLSVSNTLANSQSLSITGTQWQVLDAGNWQSIAGATGSSFTPDAAQVGKALRAAITFDDPIAIGQTATSAATSAVVADDTNTPPTGSPVIVGSAVEDQVLVVNTDTITDVNGLGSFSYQWLRNGSTVGTGVSYMLGDVDVGQSIQVRVSYIDDAGNAEVLTSQATAPVANVNDAPVGLVIISGSAVMGVTLVASHTVTDADGMPNPLSHWWQSSSDGSTWVDIPGASAANFTVVDSQLVGSLLRVRMSFVDGFGTLETVNSSATAAVADSSVINGTAVADNLVGTGNDDGIYGFGGNDTLAGGLGNDTLDGGSGNDSMSGGPGDDTYFVDSLNDVIVENPGEGNDLVVTGSVTLTLGNNIENATLVGSAGIGVYGNGLDNVITGNSAAQWIQGLAGNDTLFGMGGNDNLLGGAGNDWIDGGSGNDSMSGSTGNDTFVVDSVGDVISESVNAGNDLVLSSVSWTLGVNLENLTLTGTAAINATGNTLNNELAGNAAANILAGGAGNDTLSGGAGIDTLTGGSGNDLFAFNAVSDSGLGVGLRDIVTDFVRGQDRIDFSGIDANIAMDGDQSFNFIATAGFNAPGQIRYFFDGANTVIQGNIGGTNGNAADFEVAFSGSIAFTAVDMIP